MIPEDISKEALSENVRRFREEAGRLSRLLSRGLITDDEARSALAGLIDEHFYRVIDDQGLVRLCDRDSDQRSLEQFLIDHRPNQTKIIRPDLHQRDHDFHWHNLRWYIVGPDIWAGSVTSAEDLAPGAAVILIDHHGLRTVLETPWSLTPEQEYRKRNCGVDLIGTGCVEGYTSDRKRDIDIYLNGSGRIEYLEFEMQDDDWEVYRHFPLWEDARTEKAKYDRIWKEYLDSLLIQFMREKASRT